MERLKVGVELGNAADADGILRRRPSFVLLATGSVPMADPAMRPDGVPFYGPYDVPAGGGHVLVRDEIGRLAAMLTAERLAATWRKVTLVTSAMHPGEGEGITTSYTLVRALGRLNVDIIDRAKLVGVDGDRAILKGVFEERRNPIEGIDAVVSLLGAVSTAPLLKDLKAAGANVHCIGDAKLPRDVTAAVRDAAETVWRLDAVNEPGQFSFSMVAAGHA